MRSHIASRRERLRSTPPGYRFSIGRVLAIYGGLMAVCFLASLDQTILSTALPHIVAHFGGLANYAWVFTIYLLCTTIAIPVYGKLGDIYGRRRLLLCAIPIFLAGSALCGAAHSMTELIVFRGVQGIGGGGLVPLAMATIGELVPARDRGRYQGLIAGVFAASAVIGPTAGGLIVDHLSWRWVFFVNLPVGGTALAVVAATMPGPSVRTRRRIDFLGAGLLGLGTGSFLLGLTWAGQGTGLSSARVIGAATVSVAAFAAFVAAERRAPEPILPLRLLRQPIVGAAAASAALITMCVFGSIAFVPLFAQGVIGVSATSSGVVITPQVLGYVVASIAAGQWVSRTGRYRGILLLGSVVLGLSMVLLWRAGVSTTTLQAARDMAIVGLGVGLMTQVLAVAVQNAVALSEIGTATALLQFCQLIGSSLGVTLFGVIVSQGVPAWLRGRTNIAHRLAPQARVLLADALHPAFMLGVVACLLVLIIILRGVQQRPLRRNVEADLPVEIA